MSPFTHETMQTMTTELASQPLRLFIAIQIPEPVRNELLRARQELQELAPRDAVRWTQPEQIHLTLKFLGDVPVGRVEELKGAVKTVCAGRPALPLRAAGIGFFPNARLPRVIWAGIGNSTGQLADLQAAMAGALGSFAVKPGADRFVGHLTLGRFKNIRRGQIEAMTQRAQAMADRQFGEWTAWEIEIVRSELTPAGARHTLLASVPLK